MEFNKLIKKNLFPLFRIHGFEILDEKNNIVQFSSTSMKVNIVHNEFNKTNLIELGKSNEFLYPITDYAIESILNLKLPIENVDPEVFVNNLSILFSQKIGIDMLKGNINDLIKIITHQSSDYTAKLHTEQILEVALNFWNNKDYTGFISTIDKLDIDNLPETYQLKYRIAKNHLKS